MGHAEANPMNPTAGRAVSAMDTPATGWELYKGWVYGSMVVLIVLAVGAGFWFHYHP